jgi:carboxymethylenebutenolidase
MWNSFSTAEHKGISAEVSTYTAGNGDLLHAYVARPSGDGPFPGIVMVHHLPGWDELYREFSLRLANHGYNVISPDFYCREGHGTPDEIAAKVRAAGGLADDQVLADANAAAAWLKALPTSNGKVGIIGTCSGGRASFMVAARSSSFDAVVDLWGGRVVMAKEALNEKMPVAPIDYTKDLNIPLLGLFGNDDQAPSPAEVDQHEAALKQHGKNYEFHRYDGAGHGFFYYDRAAYRQEQAMDGWNKVFAFFQKNLA